MVEELVIYEVGPRDGLQNEATALPTSDKLAFIDRLVAAGLRRIEVTSFVSPRAVPQLADADDVMAAATERYGDRPRSLYGLVFNERGYDRAIASGCRSLAFGVAISETFSRRNTRNAPAEAMGAVRRLLLRAQEDGLSTRVYLMTAWVCPFEGPIAPHRALDAVLRLSELAPQEIAVADTIGHAEPLEVGRLLDAVARHVDISRIAVHLHDTQALGLANALAALQSGVRIFDTSTGGLGGCPFAPGAAGNLATEDLIFMAHKMGFGTGVDFTKLWDAVYELERLVGRPIGGRIRPWWEATTGHEPSVEYG